MNMETKESIMATITKTIEIQAPPEKVERMYRDFEAYPAFIAPISHVQERRDGLLDCKLQVAGWEFPYTARVERAGAGEYRWQTVDGSISHHGTARIEPAGDHTRVTMEVNYAPPGGEIAGRIANWLGLADSGLNHALESFKAHVEAS